MYLTIVEAYRDGRGKNMSRTVESLGYVDDLERSGIADPVAHFTAECARRNEAKRAETEPVIAKIGPLQRIDKRDEGARVELGAAVVDAYLNRDLGLLSFFAKIDYYLGYYDADDCIGGSISPEDAVRVLYFPVTDDMDEVVLLDDDDEPWNPAEMRVDFARSVPPLSEEHMLLAPPTHRPWETWDPPFEDRLILLQVDSFAGPDFNLNFKDFGVLDFLIPPDDLRRCRFDRVRAIVLST